MRPAGKRSKRSVACRRISIRCFAAMPCLGSEAHQANCSREAKGGGWGLLGRASNLRWTPRLLDRGRQPTCLVALMSVLCACISFSVMSVSFSHVSRYPSHDFSFISLFQVLSFFSFGFKPFQFSFSRNHKFQDVLLRSLYKTRERFSYIRYMVDQCLSHRLAVHDVCGLLGPIHCVLRLQTCLPQHLSTKP